MTLQSELSDSLSRFVVAQESCYATALAELSSGKKRSHWMWFIFPQLRGIGDSDTSAFYGIADLREARSYLKHDVLSCRLIECTNIVLNLKVASAGGIFGDDSKKLFSCMTLFELADPSLSCFPDVLQRFYGGCRDELTLNMVNGVK